MRTFDCPKCGAPVSYQVNPIGRATTQCAYCNSQLALPDELHGRPARVISQIDINIQPHVAAAAKKWIVVLVLIPVVFMVIIFGSAVLGALAGIFRSASSRRPPATRPIAAPGSRQGKQSGFANVILKFGSEGIGPGMMTDARSIGIDAAGRIYVAEYLGGRVQVFDPTGRFITQWVVDPKLPLRGMTVDRKGTVYIAQAGNITRYEGETGKSLGQLEYGPGRGFDDVFATPDGGLICSWRSHRDDIVRFDAEGAAVKTIPAAISSASGDSELDMRVTVDGLGNIYALGTFNNGVFKFAPDGRFLTRFGSHGHQPGQISAADAIAVDGKGRVFVSDSKGVQVFASDGRYLDVFKPDGVAFGMVFNDQNELFIVARTKVMKFALNQ